MIKDWIIRMLNEKATKNMVKVELSTGVVYLKPLNNGILNKCRQNSCIAGNILNDPLFFNLMDYELSNMSKSQIDKLSVKDGTKLRETVRTILIEAKVVKEFSSEDVDTLNKMKEASQSNLKKLYEGTGYKAPGVE